MSLSVLAPPAAILSAHKLERYFIDGGRRLDVLKGVSLSLAPGEVTALVGRSGSGKSTLLHLLGLLDKPDSGEVLVDGAQAARLSERERSGLRNRHIGFVFQHYFLLPEFSVLENVLMPAQIASSPATWLAQRAKFVERARTLLALTGLDRQLDQRPGTLSGGERQRVSLARALLLQPAVLLCDEPTGNLDPDTAAHIMDLIFKISAEERMAVLIVTHDQMVSSRASRLLRLDHGILNSEK